VIVIVTIPESFLIINHYKIIFNFNFNFFIKKLVCILLSILHPFNVFVCLYHLVVCHGNRIVNFSNESYF
jgi:hypothetical protein